MATVKIDAARPRKWRSLQAIRHDANAAECMAIYTEIGKLAERGRRLGISVDHYRPALIEAMRRGGKAVKLAETANDWALPLFAGETALGEHEDSWASGWIFPKDTAEGRAREWLAEVECIDLDATPQAAYSPTGRWFHGAVWFERRPSGRLFARQSGGLDT